MDAPRHPRTHKTFTKEHTGIMKVGADPDSQPPGFVTPVTSQAPHTDPAAAGRGFIREDEGKRRWVGQKRGAVEGG